MYVARNLGGVRAEAGWESAIGDRKPEMRKKLGFRELLGVPSWGVRRRKEVLLERISSVGAYDEPLMNGVPRMLNLGVPILYDGIATSSNGGRSKSISSTVLGL
jgi:hypothetical protein